MIPPVCRCLILDHLGAFRSHCNTLKELWLGLGTEAVGGLRVFERDFVLKLQCRYYGKKKGFGRVIAHGRNDGDGLVSNRSDGCGSAGDFLWRVGREIANVYGRRGRDCLELMEEIVNGRGAGAGGSVRDRWLGGKRLGGTRFDGGCSHYEKRIRESSVLGKSLNQEVLNVGREGD